MKPLNLGVNNADIQKLAIPAIFSGLAEPILSLTDTAIVGNMENNAVEALAAVGIVGSFLSMLVWLLGQVQSALTSVTGRYLGADRIYEIASLPAQAIAINLFFGLLMLMASLFFSRNLFAALGAGGLILENCVSYFGIRAWGFPFTIFTFALFGVFKGMQNTVWPMVIAISGAVLNIVLDLVLVYGIEGFIPSFGLLGAAWASLVAQIMMAFLAMLIFRSKIPFRLKFDFKPHPELRNVVFMSLNLFIRTMALNSALLLAVKQATNMGPPIIGAHTIAINIWLFAAFLIDGYATAGSSLSGKLLGAKNHLGLKFLGKQLLNYGIYVALGLMLIGFVFYGQIGMTFTNDLKVVEAFSGFFFLVLLGLPINALAFVYDGIFKGLGRMAFLRNVLLVATLLGFIPIMLLFDHLQFGIRGIWLALIFWMLLRALPLLVKFQWILSDFNQKK